MDGFSFGPFCFPSYVKWEDGPFGILSFSYILDMLTLMIYLMIFLDH